MSQKKLITTVLIILALIIFGGLFGFYYFLNQKTSDSPYASTSGSNPLSFFSNFFGGKNETPNPQSTNTVSDSNTGVFVPGEIQDNASTTPAGEIIPLLRQITTVPTAGTTAFERVIGTTTVTTSNGSKKVVDVIRTFLRFIDRATGQVYETATSTLINTRISNTTFPSVYNAQFDRIGDSLVLQKLLSTDSEIISTFYARVTKNASSTEKTLVTSSISNNTASYSVSPSGSKLFSIVTTSNGAQGNISSLDGSRKSTIWTSPLTEWLGSWINDSQILLTTKPSFGVVGYSYLLNATTGKFTKYVGYIPGLTVLPSPDSSVALVGSYDSLKYIPTLDLYRSKDHTSSTFSLRTLPEKCVWSNKSNLVVYCAVPTATPQALYPDDWYKGAIFFSDSIWKINIDSGEAKLVGDLKDLSKQDIDATNLTLDTVEDYIMFTNKRDLTLWGMRI